MSKDEFINRVKTAENGATYTMQQGESLDDLLKRTTESGFTNRSRRFLCAYM